MNSNFKIQLLSKNSRPISHVSSKKLDRSALKSLAASLAILTISSNAFAVTPVDLKDDRKAKSTGYDLIYEARDIELPQNVRDGLTQARGSVSDTEKRVLESIRRLYQTVLPSIEK